MKASTLVSATIGIAITSLAAAFPANAHDLYVGTTDPVTKGVCCTTSEHAGYGDCDKLDLEPGVLLIHVSLPSADCVGGILLAL